VVARFTHSMIQLARPPGRRGLRGNRPASPQHARCPGPGCRPVRD